MVAAGYGLDRQGASRCKRHIVADIRLRHTMIVDHDHLCSQRRKQPCLARVGVGVHILIVVGIDQDRARRTSRQRTVVPDQCLHIVVERQHIDRRSNPDCPNRTTSGQSVVTHVFGCGDFDVASGRDRHSACQAGMCLGRSVRFGQVAHNRIARTGTTQCRIGRRGRGTDQVRVTS